MPGWSRAPWRAVITILLATFVAGCGVPKHMQVRSGIHPKYQDKDVRFRTTYYFRSFDYCFRRDTVARNTLATIIPETDSLYRFKMTGKAHSLTTKVNFESGTLKADQVDPFGTAVEFDAETGRHRVVSAAETAREIQRRQQEKDLRSLLSLYREFTNEAAKDADPALVASLREKTATAAANALNAYAATSGGGQQQPGTQDGDAKVELKTLLQSLNQKVQQLPPPGDDGDGDARAKSIDALKKEIEALKGLIEKVNSATIVCPADATIRRGFQILGPEGWRTFNQDERLIMAMSSSASPLIGTLQEYSSRLNNARPNPAAQMLPLVEEQLLISEANRALLRSKVGGGDADALFDATLTAFEKGAKQ